MSGEVPLGYRIKAEGAEDTINKLKQLHEELRKGSITTREYRQEHRDLTTSNRAAVGEFNDIKNAIAASNPNLLEFTRSMSLFGGVANTAMSVMNTINLLTLANAGTNQKMSDALRQTASDYNDYVRDLEAYGPYDSRSQAAYQKWQADLNVVSNLQKQLGVESIQTAVTVAVTSVAMAGSIAQVSSGFATLRDMYPGLARALGTAGLAGGFILAAAAALSLGGALGAALNPNAQKLLDQLTQKYGALGYAILSVQSILINLDNLLGGTATDWDSFVRDAQQTWGNFVNAIIDGINAINSFQNQIARAIGGQQVGMLQHITTPADVSQSNLADRTNQLLVGTPFQKPSGGEQIANKQQLDNLIANTKANADYLRQGITQSIQGNNTQQGLLANSNQQGDTLNQINSGVGGLLQPLIDQKVATQQLKDSTTQQITQLKQIIADNISKPQTQAVATHVDSDTGAPIYDSTALTDAGQKVQDAQNKLSQLQSLQSGLDVSTSGLGPVLQSVGLISSNGVGSIISQMLGGYGSIGGAGISAAELQQFAQTGDNGIFTRAAIRDNTVTTPSKQDQIDAWVKATAKNLGIDPSTHPYLKDDAIKALGYGGAVSKGSANIGTGAFAGLPGQYGNPTNITVNVTNQGSVIAQHDFNQSVTTSVKQALQLSGF